jgi:serine/threonine-protein kinase RsbW
MVQVSEWYPSDLQHLSLMRGLILQVCQEVWCPVDAQALHQLELAVQEAATNIIRHAYRGRSDQAIQLTLEADADKVCVGLHYQGPPFDPATVPAPVFDGSRQGGFGVYLIGQLVDEVSYSHEQGRSGVRLVKKRPRGVTGSA